MSGFETARGHKMERENYVHSLKNMKENIQLTEAIRCTSPETIFHGTLSTTYTQTDSGVWLDIKKPRTKRKHQLPDVSTDVKEIKGTVLVDGSKLISDGNGGYYMRVELKDIRPLQKRPNTYDRSHRNYVPHDSNYRQCPPPGSYYANESFPSHSNYRPNPSGMFFANQRRGPNDHFDRRNAERNNTTFGDSQPKYYRDSGDLFK